MNYLLSSIIIICLLQCAFSTTGVDISQRYSTSAFECLKKNKRDFVIVRGFESTGQVDSNAVANLKDAKSAGMTTDIYMFPCVGKSASTQASELAAAIPTSLFDRVWIDVETNPSSGCGWKSASENCDFLTELDTALKGHGLHVGIYASEYMWETIFGSKTDCDKFTSNLLWYAHYDDSPSFSDYTEFGGWKDPHMKQFKGTTTECDAGVDLNYTP